MKPRLLIPVIAITFGFYAPVQAGTYGPLEYEILGGEAVIIGCDPEATEVVIPDSIEGLPVTVVGTRAFAGRTNLTRVTLPDSVNTIEFSAFEGCSNLASVDFGPEHPHYTSIAGVVYDKAVQVLSFIPPGFQGEYSLPDSVEYGDLELFSACSKMTAIEVGESNPNLSSINGVLYNKSGKILMKVPAGFSGDFVVPDGVEVISGEGLNFPATRNRAFAGCVNLTSISIPSSVRAIGVHIGSRNGDQFGESFGGCSSLERIDVDAANSDYASVDGVLFEKNPGTLLQLPPGYSGSYTVPNTTNSIQYSAFLGCERLTSLTIGSSVSSLHAGAFGPTNPFVGCLSLTAIEIDKAHTSYASIDGVVFDKGLQTLLYFPGGIAGHYSIPEGVSSIADGAFFGCSKLTGVGIPDGVTSIGYSAFSGCLQLNNVIVPDSVTSLGPSVFSDCLSLGNISLGSGITAVPDHAFGGCLNLESLEFPDSLTAIGAAAFFGCRKLAGIRIPGAVTSIGSFAFAYCTGLTGLILGNGVFFLGEPPLPGNDVFVETSPDLVAYYVQGTPGWGDTYSGVATAPFPYVSQWGGFTPVPDPDGIFVDTGSWLGWLDITLRPWVWSYKADSWLHLSEPVAPVQAGWIFIPELALESPGLRIYVVDGTHFGWSHALGKWLYVTPEAIQARSGWVYMI